MYQRKKQTRFYISHIPKLIKRELPGKGITLNAKEQLNSLLCNINKIISLEAKNLINNKKTIRINDIKLAIDLSLSLAIGDESYEKFKISLKNLSENGGLKGKSRHTKYGLIFPPSISEKFLREFGLNKVMITSDVPLLLGIAIEILAIKLLKSSKDFLKNKKKRITIRELELASRCSKQLNIIFKKNNLCFQGGGVLPYIHPKLQIKSTRKRKLTNFSHKFKPGTLAIKKIKKIQKKNNCLILSKSPFEKLVRSIFENKGYEKIKISKQVFLIFQYYIESKIIEIMNKSNLISIHGNRVKLLTEDIKFYIKLSEPLYLDKFTNIINEKENRKEIKYNDLLQLQKELDIEKIESDNIIQEIENELSEIDESDEEEKENDVIDHSKSDSNEINNTSEIKVDEQKMIVKF